jgi:hypothetical protein
MPEYKWKISVALSLDQEFPLGATIDETGYLPAVFRQKAHSHRVVFQKDRIPVLIFTK